ncbi:MAG TPA: glycosyltransferase family 4 protein [Polyangiaceae bacterium]|nr:glycosyltransferase family 4 protein [Polyangiaceae bacterium]
MRIVLVTTSYPAHEGDPSGHFVRAEARELERQGHEVVVVTPAVGGAFGWPGFAARVKEKPWRLLDAMRWTTRAARQLAMTRADRIVAHWAVPCAWPVAAAAKRAELAVVSHGADVRLLVGLPSVIRERIVGSIARRATEWRFVSAALQAQLVESLDGASRASLERITTVRAPRLELPSVEDRIARIERELDGKRVAVSVGRLVASKRVDRAIRHVARNRDVDGLVVVGDGPERARLEELARRCEVDTRFVGLVPREEALAWIGAARMVLHGSQHEGLSTVVREAEALGTPVVHPR